MEKKQEIALMKAKTHIKKSHNHTATMPIYQSVCERENQAKTRT